MEPNNVDEPIVEPIIEPIVEPIVEPSVKPVISGIELLSRFNVKSVDELTTIFEEYKSLKSERQTDLEKLQAKYDTELEKKNELAERLTQLEQQQRQDKLNNEIRNAARSRNANNPEAVLKIVDTDGLMTEDGSVNLDEVTKRIEALTETDTYLFRADVPSVPSNKGGKPIQNDDAKKAKEAILKKYRKW